MVALKDHEKMTTGETKILSEAIAAVTARLTPEYRKVVAEEREFQQKLKNREDRGFTAGPRDKALDDKKREVIDAKLQRTVEKIEVAIDGVLERVGLFTKSPDGVTGGEKETYARNAQLKTLLINGVLEHNSELVRTEGPAVKKGGR